jgi:hypothetical protein
MGKGVRWTKVVYRRRELLLLSSLPARPRRVVVDVDVSGSVDG